MQQTRELMRRVQQGLVARIRPTHFHVEVGGNLNFNTETRDRHTVDQNRHIVVEPHMVQSEDRNEILYLMRYRVTLKAQADRSITVLSRRVVVGGGIGAAGGGVGGAVVGAAAGAVTGLVHVVIIISTYIGNQLTSVVLNKGWRLSHACMGAYISSVTLVTIV